MIGTRRRPSCGAVYPFLGVLAARPACAALARLPALSGGGAAQADGGRAPVMDGPGLQVAPRPGQSWGLDSGEEGASQLASTY